MAMLAAETSPASAFGQLLRSWRAERQLSQLELSLVAETSARHLSFIETGRASPSRALVLRLGAVLDLPLRARNELLLAAGYAPVFRERPLSEPIMADARRALEHILRQQEPYPAIVVDRGWNTLMRNEASRRMRRVLLDEKTLAKAGDAADNAMKMIFHPLLYRRWVVGWEELAPLLLLRLAHEAGTADGAHIADLVREIRSYPGVPAPALPEGPLPPNQPLLTVRLRKGDLRFDYFSTITTFGAPHDITLQELRIKCFFPADSESAATFHRLAEAG
jgi:transcriptional regulator with XRE-family HTH domain